MKGEWGGGAGLGGGGGLERGAAMTKLKTETRDVGGGGGGWGLVEGGVGWRGGGWQWRELSQKSYTISTGKILHQNQANDYVDHEGQRSLNGWRKSRVMLDQLRDWDVNI